MLKEEYAVLEKVKAEIAELNVRKSGIVKELNTQLLDADSKAKAIISSAKDQAKSIIDKAIELKREYEGHAFKIKSEADDYLHQGKKCLEDCRLERTRLDNDIIDFNAHKVAFENNMRTIKNEANSLMAQAQELGRQLNDKGISLTTLEATLNRREEALTEKANKLTQDGAILSQREATLKEGEEALAERTLKVDIIHNHAVRINHEIIRLRQKTNQDMEKMAGIAIECMKSKNDQELQKKMINAQFENIDKSNKENEERKLALDEREQLLNIKDKEVTQKIKILSEVRAKGGK
jgi:hypothetical protein